MAPLPTSDGAVHLHVFAHGLWGDANHLAFIKECVNEKGVGDDGVVIEILNPDVNSGTRTYAGIDGCGARIASLVLDRLDAADKPRVTHISFIGYSQGGLILRYVIGVLEALDVFNNVAPITFATFATPHLGARRDSPQQSALFKSLFNGAAAVFAAQSGAQMMVTDTSVFRGRAIVNILADPTLPFWKGLARFKRRVCYGNITNDPLVSHKNACFVVTQPSPLPKNRIDSLRPVSADYPSIVLLENTNGNGASLDDGDSEPKRTLRQQIRTSLFYAVFISVAVIVLTGRRIYWNGISISRALHGLADGDIAKKFPESNDLSWTENTKPNFSNLSWLNQWARYHLQDDVVNLNDDSEFAFRNLNNLEWHKFHVRSTHPRAHATIIRRASEFTGNEDVVQHFVDNHL
ncbi:hypothetical protein HDU84_004599 [Entophlyctis sp. JEL0112]|nr:hypothetical protein HDU84_004599 [Entophlyctis sp. JEL0112]